MLQKLHLVDLPSCTNVLWKQCICGHKQGLATRTGWQYKSPDTDFTTTNLGVSVGSVTFSSTAANPSLSHTNGIWCTRPTFSCNADTMSNKVSSFTEKERWFDLLRLCNLIYIIQAGGTKECIYMYTCILRTSLEMNEWLNMLISDIEHSSYCQ